jgi:hypothetical protein
MLALVGGVLAAALADQALRLFVAFGPVDLPRLGEISLDSRAVGFTLVISLLSSMFFGLIPGLKYAGPQISVTIRSAGRTSSASRERHRTRNVLVVGQVALAVLLLVTAGLMIRTLQALGNVDPGFSDPKHLQIMRTSVPVSLIHNEERVTRLQQEIAAKLGTIPGVSSAAFIDQMPMEQFGSNWDEIYAEHDAISEKKRPLRLFKYVSPGLFHTTGTRLLAGRELTWEDIYEQRPVVLASESLAREMWGTASAAVGKRLREFDGMPWYEVVGIVQDTRENGVEKDAPPTVYWPPLMS